jgi:protein-tyrosine phosphatase
MTDTLETSRRSLADSVRPPLRFLRHLPDRLLHPWRRRRLLARLRAAGVPGEALFICLGNINRSPYSAGAFAREMRARRIGGVVVRSAGFIGPGRPAQAQTRELAGRNGFDLASHRSRGIDRNEVRSAGLVVVMAPEQRRRLCRMTGRPKADVVVLGDLDPEPIRRRAIQDPYGHSHEVFERVYRRIEGCGSALADTVAPR